MRRKLGTVRRQELAEATFETLKAVGFRQTTVARVAERAGLAHGLVHHYFRNKAEMIEAAIRLASSEIGREYRERLAAAETPRQRLDAAIDANLAPAVFNPPVTQAWLAFGAEAADNPRFARLLNVIYARMRSNLRGPLRALLPADRVDDVALAVGTMIDGAWMRCAYSAGPADAEPYRRTIAAYVDGELRRSGGQGRR